MHQIKRLAHWLSRRNPNYILARVRALLSRYGITPTKAKQRVINCIQVLAQYDCAPTFPTPGRVISRNGAFFRQVQAMGAELAVHGYDHLDFNSLSETQATAQFTCAAKAFENGGIRFDGFRCPYLSYSARLASAVPKAQFKYSSNQAIVWDVLPEHVMHGATAVFASLNEFYKAEPADRQVAVPKIVGNLVEIPVSVPDDLQLYDGLQLGEQGVSDIWRKILKATHQRGEIFVAMFHPESFAYCQAAFKSLLQETRYLHPTVWVARLKDVSDWWWEKANFQVHLSAQASSLDIHFTCSERATVLVRHLTGNAPTHAWDNSYHVLEGRSLHLPANPRPLLGLSPSVSVQTRAFLVEQGYIIDTSEQATQCGLYLDEPTMKSLPTEVELIRYIENSSTPLVRFWRWPEEKKSVLCFTGDLDALSLMDYVARLFAV